MAYEKTTWVNRQTPLSAENLNHMEEGIKANDTTIADLLNRTTDIIKSGFFSIHGDFSENRNYTIPITIPDGYKILEVCRVWTNGWVGSVYSDLMNSAQVSVWVANGSATGKAICCSVLFIKT